MTGTLPADETLLEIRNLQVSFPTPTGIVHAVRGLSFSLGRERLGVVGESGSGKSMTGRAILDLVPSPGNVSVDRLTYRGQDLTAMERSARRRLRGRHISMILQDPRHALNPVVSVGRQIAEAYRIHCKSGRREARERAVEMLDAVRIREPSRVFDLFPHEVSGGMGQRVMIAMMLIAEPDILIADEPTSALDVTVQLQILRILDELVTGRGMGLIFISHDLPLVRSFCDRIVVMYGGRVMEVVQAADLETEGRRRHLHPYTQGLLGCLPELHRRQSRLPTLVRDAEWLS